MDNRSFFHEHSLSLVLAALWLTFITAGGIAASHAERFGWQWCQDVFDNIQSEFLALCVFSLVSKRLIERGSPESKDDA